MSEAWSSNVSAADLGLVECVGVLEQEANIKARKIAKTRGTWKSVPYDRLFINLNRKGHRGNKDIPDDQKPTVESHKYQPKQGDDPLKPSERLFTRKNNRLKVTRDYVNKKQLLLSVDVAVAHRPDVPSILLHPSQ